MLIAIYLIDLKITAYSRNVWVTLIGLTIAVSISKLFNYIKFKSIFKHSYDCKKPLCEIKTFPFSPFRIIFEKFTQLNVLSIYGNISPVKKKIM